jgi:para-nitrobenzyl esterase
MNTYWANFAKTGNPNSQELANWPIYNEKADCILDIQPDGNLVGKSDPRKARFNVIEKAFEHRERLQTRGGI